jgi:hypothetical protein
MLIFAPSTIQQRGESSIQMTIHDRIEAAFSGNIEYLFTSVMQVKRLTQNSKSTYTGNNRCAQRAADTDNYSTAIALACSSQSIATIGPDNILHVNKLYTPPVPDRGHPDPNTASPHQPYSLTGDICQTILHSKKNKGAGINSDSIDLFITLVKSTIPSVKPDLRFIFNTIYQNNLPDVIKRYFTDVYLFCLHKDPNNHTKLCPLGIPTAIQHLIATHVARSLKSKFASHLLPYNYAVGIPDGTSFIVKAMHPNEQTNHPPAQQSSLTSPTNLTPFPAPNSST